MYDVVVSGGVFREVHSFPNREVRLGGSGLVSAIISARFSAKTALIAAVGEEDLVAAKAMLATVGVDSDALIETGGASGTFVFAREDQLAWPIYRPAEGLPLAAPQVPMAKLHVVFGIPDFDSVLAGWYDLVSPDAILIWDRQGWLSRARDSKAVASLAPSRKIYVANVDEALDEFNVASDEALSRALPPPFYEAAVIKRGSLGCSIYERREVTRSDIFGYPVDAPNTVGSGDVFLGAFSAELASGSDIEKSARVGNAAASTYLQRNRDIFAGDLVDRARALATNDLS